MDINKPQTVFDWLQLKLHENLDSLSETVSTGGAQDFAQYQRMVGQIEGITLAERELLELKEKFYRDEDV